MVKKFPRQTLDRLGTFRLPKQGVYFFFEPNELRQGGKAGRVVRVGTHAAVERAKATLYKRLYNHKGTDAVSQFLLWRRGAADYVRRQGGRYSKKIKHLYTLQCNQPRCAQP